MSHTVSFEKRDFSGPQPAPGLVLDVERMSWRAVGGPWKAQLTARASDAARLWQAAELLRCGVKVFDDLGAAWWGYVSAVTLHWEDASARVSTDELANDVMVRYKSLSPDPWGGEDTWTAAAVDAASVAKYGRRQQVFGLGPATLQQAEAFRWSQLARHAWPAFDAGPIQDRSGSGGTGSSGVYAVIECRGYWETLDWLFYKDSRGMVGHAKSGSNLAMKSGGGAAGVMYAQTFKAGAEAWKVNEVWLRVGKEGNPTDNLRIEVWSGAVPGAGSMITSLSLNGTTMPNERAWIRYPMALAELAAGGSYYLKIYRGATDAVNFYNLSLDQTLGYADGALTSGNNTTPWVPLVPDGDLAFIVRGVVAQDAILLRILEQSGQFLAGGRMETALGFDGVPYRDGRERGRAEVEAVLKQGTPTGGRLLARVEADRWLRVFAQPDSALPELTISQGGVLCWRDGRRLHSSELAAGRWASLGLQSGAGGQNAAAFVEGCSWDAARGLHLAEV